MITMDQASFLSTKLRKLSFGSFRRTRMRRTRTSLRKAEGRSKEGRAKEPSMLWQREGSRLIYLVAQLKRTALADVMMLINSFVPHSTIRVHAL